MQADSACQHGSKPELHRWHKHALLTCAASTSAASIHEMHFWMARQIPAAAPLGGCETSPKRCPTVILHMRRRCGRALSRLLGSCRRGRYGLLPWAGQVDQAAGAGLGRGWRHSLLQCRKRSAGTA